MDKNHPKLSLRTVPNGYALTVEGEEFMYFNLMDLLAGVCVHIGMQKTEEMERGSIVTMLFETMLGKKWEESLIRMSSKVSSLESKTEETSKRLNNAIKIGEKAEPELQKIKNTLFDLTNSIKEQKRVNRDAEKSNREAKAIVDETLTTAKKESENMKNLVENTKRILDDVDKLRKEANEKMKLADKIFNKAMHVKAIAEALENDSSKKKSGGRSKADTYVLEELERKKKENPNII